MPGGVPHRQASRTGLSRLVVCWSIANRKVASTSSTTSRGAGDNMRRSPIGLVFRVRCQPRSSMTSPTAQGSTCVLDKAISGPIGVVVARTTPTSMPLVTSLGPVEPSWSQPATGRTDPLPKNLLFRRRFKFSDVEFYHFLHRLHHPVSRFGVRSAHELTQSRRNDLPR